MNCIAECGMGNGEGDTQQCCPVSFAPHSARRTPNSRGFTLLEVMVAVMILGLVLVSLLGLKNRGMEDVMVAERMTSATLLAKRLMTEVITRATTQLQLMEEEGEFPEEEFKTFSWKKSVTPTPLPTVMEVRVAVLWKEGSRDEQVELVSYE